MACQGASLTRLFYVMRKERQAEVNRIQKTSILKITLSSLNLGKWMLQIFTSSIKAAVIFWLSGSEKAASLE